MILYLLYTTLVTLTSAEQCSDLDSTLCSMVMNKAPDICGDPCLAKICNRSCGNCALQCYECPGISFVSNCSHVVTCDDPTDYCFTAKTFSLHFTEVYKMGCGSRQICMQYASNTVNSEAGCCNQDRCNNKPPPLLKLTGLKIFQPINTTICQNKDDEICSSLDNHMKNPCDDDCIASKLCPKMCGRCYNCLNCYDVNHPDNCTEIIGCELGKLCFGLEKLRPDFSSAVQLGCVSQTQCSKFESSSIHIFGKRSFSLNGNCCQGEKCNAHPMNISTNPSLSPQTSTIQTTSKSHETTTFHQTRTTTPTLTTQSQQSTWPIFTTTELSFTRPYPTKPSSCKQHYTFCPEHYMTIYGDCYLYGIPENKTGSEKLCRDYCANLITFQSRRDVEVIHIIGNHGVPVTEFYTDMERGTDNRWYWRHNRSPVASELLEHFMYDDPSLKCAIVYYKVDFYHRTLYGFRPVSCTDHYNPLCMIS